MLKWNWFQFFRAPRRYLRARRIIREAKIRHQRLEDMREAIIANVGLHTLVMLRGQRGIHYYTMEDLARIISAGATEAELNSILN